MGKNEWACAAFENTELTPGESEWTYLKGVPYSHKEKSYKYIVPTFYAQSVGPPGVVWFDDIVVTEKTAAGTILKTWRGGITGVRINRAGLKLPGIRVGRAVILNYFRCHRRLQGGYAYNKDTTKVR